METKSTKPVLLYTQVLLNEYWPQVEPLLAASPVAKEYPPEQVFKAMLAGQMFMFAFVTEDKEVELILLLTGTPSETYPTMTIVTVAGKNIRKHITAHWENLKGWCAMNGARAIDAYVPEEMETFVGKLGLKRETVHVRLGL